MTRPLIQLINSGGSAMTEIIVRYGAARGQMS